MTHSGMLVALVVALLTAPTADAPQARQQAPATFRAGVDLVVVDVVVVDKDGMPVTDLVTTWAEQPLDHRRYHGPVRAG